MEVRLHVTDRGEDIRLDSRHHYQHRSQVTVQVRERCQHSERSAHRSLRVVFVHGRDAEQAEDAVSYESLERAAEVSEDGGHPIECASDEGSHYLRVLAFGEPG